MLEYDDGAFYYFSISVLTFILIPITWSLFSTIVWGETHIKKHAADTSTRVVTLINFKRREAR